MGNVTIIFASMLLSSRMNSWNMSNLLLLEKTAWIIMCKYDLRTTLFWLAASQRGPENPLNTHTHFWLTSCAQILLVYIMKHICLPTISVCKCANNILHFFFFNRKTKQTWRSSYYKQKMVNARLFIKDLYQTIHFELSLCLSLEPRAAGRLSAAGLQAVLTLHPTQSPLKFLLARLRPQLCTAQVSCWISY